MSKTTRTTTTAKTPRAARVGRGQKPVEARKERERRAIIRETHRLAEEFIALVHDNLGR